MASALFASRNENHWGERKVYMRKNPRAASGAATTTTTTTTTSSSSNPNPRPYATAIAGPNNPNSHQKLGGDPGALELSPRSEDCSSFSHQPSNFPGFNHQREPPGGGRGGYVVFNVSAYSRKEVRDLKRRLVGELEKVRTVASWIESRDFHSGNNRSGGFSASGSYGGGEPREATSSRLPPFDSTSAARSDLPKQKKVPRGSGSKRPRPSVVSPREPKRPGGVVEAAMGESEKLVSSMIKKCEQILTKLMKHKHGWVFNVPVDVVGMGLHDYHQIVKKPMDLGTVKTRLSNNLYLSPIEFAEDVRLTFNNALLYNPIGHDVYMMAEKLLRLFEELFGPAQEKLEKQQRAAIGRERVLERQRSHVPVDLPPALPAKASTPRPPPPPPVSVPQQLPPPQVPSARPVMAKQPKPKAKDPNKREMTYEEKQKLSVGLESLPQEKMSQVLQIVRRNNPEPAVLTGGEIELDFETLNTETLWDLDRFVCNCKKNMSKMRRQGAIMAAAAPLIPVASNPTNNNEDKVPVLVGDTPESTAKKSRRVGAGEQGEEDVDIGDEEMPSGHFPPVEIEKDAGHESSSSDSSSNSSSSSSSSDSDSRSSSDSESDADEAQSPAVGLRPPPQPPRS